MTERRIVISPKALRLMGRDGARLVLCTATYSKPEINNQALARGQSEVWRRPRTHCEESSCSQSLKESESGRATIFRTLPCRT